MVRLAFLTLLLGFLCAAADARAGLFGTDETRSNRLTPFPKWTDMLDRDGADRNLGDPSCRSRSLNKCHITAWRDFLQFIRNEDRAVQIESVNRLMNQLPYITDPINWGVPDYWATPRQFFIKNGDCEDYAIAKYMSLRELGFSADQLRIVVLKDSNLDIMHAVLAVQDGGRNLILDNQIAQVVEDSSIYHYQPVFSINETSWWRHR